MSRLRSLHARREPEVGIRVEFEGADGTNWIYRLAFTTQSKRSPLPTMKREIVAKRRRGEEKFRIILTRPNSTDKADPRLLTQTHLQQINTNRDFREPADASASVMYLHVVPQLIRKGEAVPSGIISEDALGRDLLERMRRTPKKSRDARFKRIEDILRITVLQFKRLTLTEADQRGRPHLEVEFMHWCATGARQNETQFSDGTLRLIGLLWALQEKGGVLLLKEPELSLHSGILSRLTPFIHRAQRAAGERQVLISTHSEHLLSDEGIAPDEILLVQPLKEGSGIEVGASNTNIRQLMMQAGLSASEVVLLRTQAAQLNLFDKVTP